MALGLLVWKAAIRGFCERVDRVGRIAAVRKAAAIEGFTENGLPVMAEEQLCRSTARRMHDAMVLMLTTMTKDTANAKCTPYRVLRTEYCGLVLATSPLAVTILDQNSFLVCQHLFILLRALEALIVAASRLQSGHTQYSLSSSLPSSPTQCYCAITALPNAKRCGQIVSEKLS